MQLVDALVTVGNRHHSTWALTVDNIVLLRRSGSEGTEYVARVLSDPPTQLWTAVIATPQPRDIETSTLEDALAWLADHGYHDALVSNRWLTTAHGTA